MLSESIVRWVNRISFVGKQFKDITEFSDGGVFITVLNHLNSASFGSVYQVLSHQQSDNWMIDMSRLRLVLDKLNEFANKEFQINVMAIAKDKNSQEIIDFWGLICLLIMQSDIQDDFIGPVLSLEEADQDLISEFLQTLVGRSRSKSFEEKHLVEKIDELENENHKLQALNQEQEHRIVEITRHMHLMEEELKDKQEVIHSLEEQSHKTSLSEQIHIQLQDSLRQVSTLQEQVKDLQHLNIDLQSQLAFSDQLKDENDQFRKRIQQLNIYEQKVDEMKDKLAQERNRSKTLLEDKEKQYLKMQTQFQEIYNQYSAEKKKSLGLELELQKLQQKFQEATYQHLEKEQNLLAQIKQISRRSSIHEIKERANSCLNEIMLHQELNMSQDFMQVHQGTLNQAEEHHKKEIELLNEKNKTLDQQLKAWKSINQRLEDKNKELESKINLLNENGSTQNLRKQNDQIQMLTAMVNTFHLKFKQLKEEHQKIIKAL